jgi:hypothetical protein
MIFHMRTHVTQKEISTHAMHADPTEIWQRFGPDSQDSFFGNLVEFSRDLIVGALKKIPESVGFLIDKTRSGIKTLFSRK